MILLARWCRFWHCLRHALAGHRAVTVRLDRHTVYVGCACGANWYGDPRWVDEVPRG